ncbi:MAG: response regulator, partial [Chthoniobacterales bacterium]|nr:response regulator [Chthoniobacterales bacterium]
MPAPSSTTAGTAGNILLVEEYGALAAAIGSALKKFAPGHQVRAVSALADAESAAVDLQPQLLIVDVDPPQSGIVDFFAKLKFTCPDARVLIIAAGLSRDVISARRATAAFEFIEKPFDLAELGRAVESQLAESSGPESTLRSVGLADLLPLLCSSRATAAITVEAAGGRWGEIHLAGGQIVHAVAGGRVGMQALHEILSWPAVRVTETEREETAPRTITAAWQTALLEAFAESKEVLDKPPRQKRQRAASKEPKKLVVVDDTELLLVFVEDILATALPELQIDLAGSGLDGLRQISATKPDAVLLDYSLPDITGNEVCRRLLEDERTAGIPVVMMSGHVPELTATALRYGNVVATIAKPFLSSALVELVRSTLAEAPKLKKPRTVADPVQSPSEAAPPSEPEAPALSVPERNGNRSNIESPGDLLPPEADERSATREIVPSERQAPPPVTGIESEPEPLPKPADEPEPPEAAPTELTPAKSITEVTRPEPALPVPLLTSAVGTSHSDLRPTVFPQASTPQSFANIATASA